MGGGGGYGLGRASGMLALPKPALPDVPEIRGGTAAVYAAAAAGASTYQQYAAQIQDTRSAFLNLGGGDNGASHVPQYGSPALPRRGGAHVLPPVAVPSTWPTKAQRPRGGHKGHKAGKQMQTEKQQQAKLYRKIPARPSERPGAALPMTPHERAVRQRMANRRKREVWHAGGSNTGFSPERKTVMAIGGRLPTIARFG